MIEPHISGDTMMNWVVEGMVVGRIYQTSAGHCGCSDNDGTYIQPAAAVSQTILRVLNLFDSVSGCSLLTPGPLTDPPACPICVRREGGGKVFEVSFNCHIEGTDPAISFVVWRIMD